MREGQLTCGKSGYSFLEVSFEAFENPLCLTVIKKQILILLLLLMVVVVVVLLKMSGL